MQNTNDDVFTELESQWAYVVASGQVDAIRSFPNKSSYYERLRELRIISDLQLQELVWGLTWMLLDVRQRSSNR